MSLRTSVKVSSITNLSDARYCSGMGVDMLGFRSIPDQNKYVTPERYQEMKGWLAGPKIVAEIYGLQEYKQLDQVMAAYQPDLLEFSMAEFHILESLPKPGFLSLTYNEYLQNYALISTRKDELMYLMVAAVTDGNHISEMSETLPVLLKVDDQFDISFLSLSIQGIVLEGSEEEKPGLKSYGVLADALELLEE